jgi:hypothetical protein
MTTSELQFLIVDGPREPDCPYCEQPGGNVPHAGYYMHQHCYVELGIELAALSPANEQAPIQFSES